MTVEWMSIRFSSDRQLSMKFSTTSSPYRSMYDRMRLPWLAVSSIILRLVWPKKALFLKKSLCP